MVPEVLDQPWPNTDFMDFAHFNEAGTTKFAETLHRAIAGHLRDVADHKPASAASAAMLERRPITMKRPPSPP